MVLGRGVCLVRYGRKILDIMWIEGLSTRDKQSFLVRRALVLVLCHKKLLLTLFSISEVFLVLSNQRDF